MNHTPAGRNLARIRTTKKPTRTLLIALLLGPLAALHAADELPPAQQPPATAFLYQPEKATIADVIPYFWNGQFHVMHLQKKPGQMGWDWAQIITPDFDGYTNAGIAIPGTEDKESPDLAIYTGSVIEKDGTLYAFYTGNNRFFKPQGKAYQQIFRATSVDGIHWKKDPDFMFNTGENPYYRFPHACRDPFVFWNPEKKEYGMLITAAARNFDSGSLAYAGSQDLSNWTLEEPFVASGRFPGYECPDLFYWGDHWYLLFSTYSENPGSATRYMMAPSLAGPWTSPVDDFFDGGSLYAAKSVSDGTRRFLCGTLTRREPDEKGVSTDEAANGWSGHILIYEMLRRENGTLGVRIPPEVERSFGEPVAVKLPQHPQWAPVGGGGVRAAQGPLSAKLGTLPSRCLVSAELTVPPTGRAGFWFGGDKDGKEGFRLFVDVGTQRLAWDRNERPMGSNPEKERNYRPLPMKPGDRIRVKVALDGNAAVASANDDVCLSTRMYDRRENTFGIWSDTVGSEFASVTLQVPQATEKAGVE